MPPLIAPSILSADFACLGDQIRMLDAAGADWIHLDVMDGHFVPNLTFGPPVVRALRSATAKPFDAHLMVSPVDAWIQPFAEAGCQRLTVHVEAGPHLHRSLQAIRAAGLSAGVALNPGTPALAVAEVLDLVDLVLVMTVNPGFGGQKFLASQLPKIAAVRAMIAAAGRPIHLQVDGGIAPDTIARVVEAGADVVVAGNAIFAAAEPAAAIAHLKAAGSLTP